MGPDASITSERMPGFQGKDPLQDDLIALGDGRRGAQPDQQEVRSQQGAHGQHRDRMVGEREADFGYGGDAAGRRVRMPNLLCRQH